MLMMCDPFVAKRGHRVTTDAIARIPIRNNFQRLYSIYSEIADIVCRTHRGRPKYISEIVNRSSRNDYFSSARYSQTANRCRCCDKRVYSGACTTLLFFSEKLAREKFLHFLCKFNFFFLPRGKVQPQASASRTMSIC